MQAKHANKFKVDGKGVYFVLTLVCVGKISPADAKERQKFVELSTIENNK